MSYQKQNFANGEVLSASQLNHIEDGIVDVESAAKETKTVVDKIIDPTLSLSGKAADAKATGDAIQVVRGDLASEISRAETAEKANADNIATEVERAQAAESALSTKITEETERAKAAEQANADGIGQLKEDLDTLNQGGLNLKEDFIGQQVNEWLDEHPEATTTVQDASLEVVKFTEDAKLHILKDYITPQMFGAVGDGVTDDSNAIQLAIDSIRETIYTTNVMTNTATSVVLYFPKGIYKITKPLNFKEMHSVDFGNAIIVSDFDDYMIISKAYKSTYSGGVFIGNKGFKITNDNLDQGNIHLSNMEFKNCDIAIEYNVQSSQITITKCLFDNCLHPIIQYASDSATIENNWFTSPVPVDYDSNFYFRAGKIVFNNNVLVPIVGNNNGVETAWIEMKGKILICQNNRFGGEEGARTAINLKNKYTNDNQSNVFFENNHFDCNRDERSCIRLYTFPNTLVVKNNYSGQLIRYVLSITESQVDSFNSILADIISSYTSANIYENPYFYDVKFRRFLFDVDNNFIMGRETDDNDMINERENEYWFLLNGYMTIIGKEMRFSTSNYKAQKISASSTSFGVAIFHLPIFTGSFKIKVTFNPNYEGASYTQTRIFHVIMAKYYADEVINKTFIKETTIDYYPDNVVGNVDIGVYDDTGDYFGDDIPFDSNKRICVKCKGIHINDVTIEVSSL